MAKRTKRSPRSDLICCIILDVIGIVSLVIGLLSDGSVLSKLTDIVVCVGLLYITAGAVFRFRDLTGHWPDLRTKDLMKDKGD